MNNRRVILSRMWLIVGLVALYTMLASHFVTTAVITSADDADMSVESTTCFTCTDASSNSQCNRYALDKPCDQGVDVCQTVHKMNASGTTVGLTKRCVTAADCKGRSVGCTSISHDGMQTCTACCDVSYCNEFAPTNSSTAIATCKACGSSTSIQSAVEVLFPALLFVFLMFGHGTNGQLHYSVNS